MTVVLMIKRVLTVVTFFVMITIVSCNKKLDINSTHLNPEQQSWLSADDAKSGLFAIYGLFRSALANNNNYWLWGELRNGDFTATSRADLKAVIEGKLNSSYQLLDDMKDWRRFYAVINAANLFIERSKGALKDPRYTTLIHNVDVAQARGLRAWAYFMITRIWGDAPFITNSFDGQFPQLPRTSQTKILNFCETELLEAVKVLPYKYQSNDPIFPYNYNTDDGRFENTLIGIISAYDLLAHIAAWQGHYADAEVYAQFVLENYSRANIDLVTIATLTKPDGLFRGRGDNKQILGVNFVYEQAEANSSGIGHIESWTLASPLIVKPKPDIYVSADSINSAFTYSRDNRFQFDTTSSVSDSTVRIVATENYFTNYNSEIPIFSKIKVLGSGNTNGTFAIYSSAIVFSRLEEVFLLKAEASAVLKNINGSTGAIGALNTIRGKRGLPSYLASKDGDLIDAIFKERRRELMGEGWRWYDLVRYNKIKRTDAAFNKLIDEGGIFWPVSSAVIAANPTITQNDYWLRN